MVLGFTCIVDSYLYVSICWYMLIELRKRMNPGLKLPLSTRLFVVHSKPSFLRATHLTSLSSILPLSYHHTPESKVLNPAETIYNPEDTP
jgi:hypothetical protein